MNGGGFNLETKAIKRVRYIKYCFQNILDVFIILVECICPLAELCNTHPSTVLREFILVSLFFWICINPWILRRNMVYMFPTDDDCFSSRYPYFCDIPKIHVYVWVWIHLFMILKLFIRRSTSFRMDAYHKQTNIW